MRKIIFSVVFFLVAGSVFAQEFTFRGLPWGSSMNDVIAKERKPSHTYKNGTESVLSYNNIEIAGVNADLDFTFSSKNRLIKAKYEIESATESVFRSITVNLRQLYGRTTEERHFPKGSISEDTEIWSFSWFVQKTAITYIYQIKDKDDVYATIEYKSPEANIFNGL